MAISATGNRRAARDAGFSLVEAMITLVIIALITSAVMLAAPGPGRETRTFAEQFAARIGMASDASIIENRAYALVVNESGYGFSRLDEGGWRLIEHGSPLAFRVWPADISARLEASGAEVIEDRVARFDAMGAATPARLVISGTGARWMLNIDQQGRAALARIDE